MRISVVGIGAILATMSVCTLLNIYAIQENRVNESPSTVNIDNSVTVYDEDTITDSFRDNDYNYEQHSESNYAIESKEDYNQSTHTSENYNSDKTPDNTQNNTPRENNNEPANQQAGSSNNNNNAIPEYNNNNSNNSINQNNNSTITTEENNNIEQKTKEPEPVKQENICEYCGKEGELHRNLRRWMDVNGELHITHNKDCTEAYMNQYVQSDSELNCN